MGLTYTWQTNFTIARVTFKAVHIADLVLFKNAVYVFNAVGGYRRFSTESAARGWIAERVGAADAPMKVFPSVHRCLVCMKVIPSTDMQRHVGNDHAIIAATFAQEKASISILFARPTN